MALFDGRIDARTQSINSQAGLRNSIERAFDVIAVPAPRCGITSGADYECHSGNQQEHKYAFAK
jgi:hypothetical protein